MTPSAHHTRRDTPTHSTRTTYERLINLVLALKDSTRPLRGRWIIEHVSGYGDVPEESRLRKLTRDIAQLRDLGFVITAVEDGYLIDFSHTIDVHFTREEMEVIALASKFALSGDLAVLGQRAWVKLSAAGSLGTVAPVHGVPDGTDLTGPDFSTVLHAITTGTVVQFLYYPSVEDEPVQRTVEPWALVPHNGRWYLTCFDLERNEPRSFRLARINSIDDTGVAASHIAHRVNTDLKELVSSVVNRETIAHETRSSVRSRLDSLRAGITDSSTWILPTSMPKLEDTDHSVDECDIPSVSHQHHTELLRLFTIVPYLRQHSGVTLFEAAHDLAMSPRQLKNDITTLTFCGLPGLAGGDLIDIDADPRHIFLWADQGLTAPVGLTMEEASAILMALGTIDSISGIVDSDTIRRAEYKLRKMAGHHADAIARSTQGGNHALVSTVADAIMTTTTLALVYGDFLGDDDTNARNVDPLMIVVVDGVSYLRALSLPAPQDGGESARHSDDDNPFSRENIRHFRIDRIRSVQPQGPSSLLSKERDRLCTSINPRDPFGFQESTHWARVWLAPSVRWIVDYEQVWPVTNFKGGLIVDIPGRDRWIHDFLLRHGGAAIPLEPPELRESIARCAEAEILRYR